MASLGAMMGMTTVSTPSRVLLFSPNLIPLKRRTITCSIPNNHKNKNLSIRTAPPTKSLLILSNNHKRRTITCSNNHTAPPEEDILSGSTRTVTTILAVAALCIKAFVTILPPPDLSLSIGVSSSSMFFASIMKRSTQGSLNTPLTVVAAGLKKWLDIYSGVLLVRVLLSWFPNIPWERQPLSAIRDLCDPYLSLFRNIIPPVFNSLDISPLLAFAVLGTLANILTVPV
ncbi:ylmG homolog protein 1-2, chloroplastic-like [Trifolium pratense]|uniref:ylmG homolog protein 1-2, chloroplastic-like n=1 Tax=Trifolium pratense TaxID=57577 RepID=UPI001E695926|nr:ylmG homolog protein 1-2, chloroplastic-like [Trifolium pratense]